MEVSLTYKLKSYYWCDYSFICHPGLLLRTAIMLRNIWSTLQKHLSKHLVIYLQRSHHNRWTGTLIAPSILINSKLEVSFQLYMCYESAIVRLWWWWGGGGRGCDDHKIASVPTWMFFPLRYKFSTMAKFSAEYYIYFSKFTFWLSKSDILFGPCSWLLSTFTAC